MKTITGKSSEQFEHEMKSAYALFEEEEMHLVQEHTAQTNSFSKLLMLFYQKIKDGANLEQFYDSYMSIKVLQLVYNTWKQKSSKKNTYEYEDFGNIAVKPGVFSPQFASDSYLWAKYMSETKTVEGKSVLEMGAGTGIISFYLHEHANPKKIVACDINKNAVENMSLNREKRGVSKEQFEIRESNLYENVSQDEKFDVIFWAYVWLKFNDKKMIAIFESETDDVIRSLLRSIIDPNYFMLERFLEESKKQVTNQGKILLITTDFMPNEFIKQLAEKLGYTFSITKFTDQVDVVKSAKMVLDLYQIELRLKHDF